MINIENEEIQNILKDTSLTKEQKKELIKQVYEQELKEIEKERWLTHAKNFGGAALEIGSAAIPIGAGARLGIGITKALAPKLGKKIAQEIGTGLVSGGLSGAVGGFGQGMLEDKNPVLTSLGGGALGALGGGALGALGGQVAKNINQRNLQKLKTKTKDWGIAYRKANKTPELAIQTLLENKKGFVPKAFYKKGIGDIDLVWGKSGKDGYGLAHILERRTENGLNGENFIKKLPSIIENGKVIRNSKQPNIAFIKNDDDSALIKLVWNDKKRKWIVTAFKDKKALKEAVDSTPDIVNIKEDMPTSSSSLNAIDSITDNVEKLNPNIKINEEILPYSDDIKTRSLSQSILNAKGTPTEIKEALSSNIPTYNVLHNKDLIKQANKEILENFGREQQNLLIKKDKLSALDFEKARQISKQLFDIGDYESALNLINKVNEEATKQGQGIQALSLWSNMTPEGAIRQADRLLNEYNKKHPKKPIKLTGEQIETIKNLQTQAFNETDKLAKEQALARTMKYIAELVPANALQKLKTIRNLNLLLNPKTLGRNIIGNAIFNTFDTGAKALAVPIDRAIGLFTGQKTRVLPSLKEYGKGFVQGGKTGFKEALEGIDTRGTGQRFDLNRRRVFDSKVGQAFETALDVGLKVPDRAFYEATFAESLNNMMKAQGLKEPTQKIIEQAEKEALEAVFQNESISSKATLGIRNLLNGKIGNSKGLDFGLGDLLIPYAQTPANLTQQGINYSPLGAIKAVGNLAKGNQREASLDIARAILGSGAIGGGYVLAKNGLMTPSKFDDNYQTNSKIKANLRPLGIAPDQIGDIWYSPFQPSSIPLSVGASIAMSEDPLEEGLQTVLNLPFMENANRFSNNLKNYGVGTALADYAGSIPAQFVPTALSQIVDLYDNNQYETYSPNKFRQGLNRAIAKTPFRRMLPRKYDVTGQPMKKYESEGLQRAYDVLLNPTYVNKKKDDFVLSELKNLYDLTGETSQFLPIADRKINYLDNNKEKQTLNLTGEQLSKYQKNLGQLNYNNLTDLMLSPNYQNLNEDDKIKQISDNLSENNKIVKSALFGTPETSLRKLPTIESKRRNFFNRKNRVQKVNNQVIKEAVLNEIMFRNDINQD